MDLDSPHTAIVPTRLSNVVGRILSVLPRSLRNHLLRHREVLKFLIVGGTCWLIAASTTYALKLTILASKPVTALAIGTILATIVSYVLNREWSFNTRGGRERHHEAALFFSISAIGVAITSAPMLFARYVLHLHEPNVSLLVQEVSDFLSGIILGTLLAMVFRLWAFKRFVFPRQNARPRRRRVVAVHPEARTRVEERAG